MRTDWVLRESMMSPMPNPSAARAAVSCRSQPAISSARRAVRSGDDSIAARWATSTAPSTDTAQISTVGHATYRSAPKLRPPHIVAEVSFSDRDTGRLRDPVYGGP